MKIPDSAVASYGEQGYLVCPDLVAPEELELLKRDTADIARGKYPCETFQPLPPDTTDEQVLRSILCIHQVHFISPVMLNFVKHPGMAAVLSRIIGPNVKCMQSMLFVKPPGFQGQAWHQDEIYIPTRDRSLCGGWIAIDDATIENGCLWVIPGSHQNGYLYAQRPHNNSEEFDFAEESFGFDESREIPVEVAAGTVVFFNGYLLHRSRKNRSKNNYRRVLVSHYMNAYSLLPWSIKDGERMATADRRAIVVVAGEDPYAWKGYEEPVHNVWLRKCKAVEELQATKER
ncbi:MAG: phytanoyl-CoA dioxygenase family protein [Candidatus Hydrogenedentes bacterium]|nr:phytanoyl-CoA dioxygenase family protein [Candidatus Hydrogenedentota bacterium]